MLSDSFKHKWVLLFLLPAWVFISFFTAQLLVKALIWLVSTINSTILDSIDKTVLNTSVSALVYVFTVSIVILAPKIIQRINTTRSEIGIVRLPSWMDLLITPAGMIVYLILSSVLIIFIQKLIPGFDATQAQDVGFSQLNRRYELMLAFATLVVIAPVAEEVLFRGYLFGKLKKYIPIWLAILATSLAFGFIHGAWNIAIDTFALSIILCLLRQLTGNIWAPILLHTLKNGIAFYFLFINPTLLDTIVK